MDRVQARIAAMESVSNADNLNDSAVRLRGLERAIQVHERRIAILNDILQNANLTEEQMAKVEARISHMENVTAQLNDLNEAKKEKLVTKLMAVSNLTEDEAEDAIENRGEARGRINHEVENETDDSEDSDDDSENETEED
jgi:uncharacterized protein YigA (DUF484 family)